MNSTYPHFWRMAMACFFITAMACEAPTSSVTKESLILAKVEKQKASVAENRSKRCQQNLYHEANTIVDSLILADVKKTKDMIPKPPRPDKPEKPDLLVNKDSTRFKNINLDSLKQVGKEEG